MLEARHVSFQTDDRWLVKDVSLSLPPGELVAIIGPNGAGKSTLMRILTGYTIPTQGKCLFMGKPIQSWDHRQLAKHRAVMSQHCQIHFPFSVREVIEMGALENSGRRHSVQEQFINEVIEQTECQPLLERYFRQLSGGEQQRVHLARVLVQLWSNNKQNKRWLFLDEPTSALDLYYQQQILRLLKKLAHERAFSVCCILHDLNLAALYADRLVLLHQGNLIAQGLPAEILKEDLLRQRYLVDLGITHHPEHTLPQIYLRQ